MEKSEKELSHELFMRRKRLNDILKELQKALDDVDWAYSTGDVAANASVYIANAIRALIYEIATNGAPEEEVKLNIVRLG